LIIYLLLRPKTTMDDEFREKLNEELLIHSLVKPRLCSECQLEISSNWLYCPSCKKQLRKPCVKCGNNLDVSWELCPFCGAENLRTFKDLAEDK
jgi:predicted amidophosphoribosyltransferase